MYYIMLSTGVVLLGGRTMETRTGKDRDRTPLCSALLTCRVWVMGVGHGRGRKGRPEQIARDVGAHTLSCTLCTHNKGFRGEGRGWCQVSGISGSSVDNRQQEVGACFCFLLLLLRASGLEA